MLHRWGDPVQHLWLSASRTAMDRSARLFLCLRCREQVVLCSDCDHGQVYCGPACSLAARREHRRRSAQRYQSSRPGRLKHAARMACWRRRRRSLRLSSAGANANKVTHQGCLPMPADVSLPACQPSNACEPIEHPVSAAEVVLPAALVAVAVAVVAVVVASAVAPAPASAAPRCRLCGCAVLPHVRLGWLRRRSVAPGGRHDHFP